MFISAKSKYSAIPPSFLVLLLYWLFVQAFLFNHFGIVTKGEAIKYISEAGYWKQHHVFSQPKYLFYSVYIFLVYVGFYIGSGAVGIYIFQLGLCAVSLFFFFKLVKQITNSVKYANLAGFLLISCIPWQSWTTHIYTESIFISLTIIFTYYFLKPVKSKLDFFLTIILLLLLLFTRPTGLLFLPIIAISYCIKMIKEKKWEILILGSAIAFSGIIIVINHAMKGEGEFDFIKPFIEEHIICGVPQAVNNNLVLPADGNSVQGLFYYIRHNPAHFLKLSFQKSAAFFGFTRSYYSSKHNLVLTLFFYPLYILAFTGLLIRRKEYNRYSLFFTAGILIFASSVILTCDDWLNRFIMPVLPYIIVLATTGIITLINYFRKKKLPE